MKTLRLKFIRFYYPLHWKYLQGIKLRLVEKFHSLFPGKYCWADCVSFAFSPTRFNPFKIDGTKGCEIDSREHEWKSCYCGQWSEGVCFYKLPKAEQEKINAERKAEFDKTKNELPF